jgi:hypothetical protein
MWSSTSRSLIVTSAPYSSCKSLRLPDFAANKAHCHLQNMYANLFERFPRHASRLAKTAPKTCFWGCESGDKRTGPARPLPTLGR